ncbi:protein TIFY 10b-like [Lolium rigidum]|uniref:protein TIFY 10b-like n=1 Tax=Lolium rigidum TaxID=89674 RepID=UPI001F5D7F72|nr:protein TIFY 10b-like [Lolium rigidum]
MAASARQGERATSFAMACNLLSQFVRKNGAAAVDLGLGINKVEAEPKTTLPGADEAGRKTMELFPQSAGLGAVQDAAAPDATREQEKQQLTIFYGGKVLVFNDFPADKAKGLMQLASKGNPVVSAPATVADTTKVQAAVPVLESSLPAAQADAPKPARANTSDMPIARKASLHRFLEKRKDRLHAKAPYQASPSDASPVKKEPENQAWLGLGPNAALKPNHGL